jgi:hypothetical protein
MLSVTRFLAALFAAQAAGWAPASLAQTSHEELAKKLGYSVVSLISVPGQTNHERGGRAVCDTLAA